MRTCCLCSVPSGFARNVRPYRAFFRSEFSSEMQAEFKDNQAKIVDWIKENIERGTNRLFRGFPTPQRL